MKKKRKAKAPSKKVSGLVHLLSRLFLVVILLLLVGLVMVAVFAASPGEGFKSTINATYSAAIIIAVPLAALMILFAGYQYVTAGFEPNQVKEAKETIVYAIGGLALLFLGYRILLWLVNPGSPLEALKNIMPAFFTNPTGGNPAGGDALSCHNSAAPWLGNINLPPLTPSH